LLELRARPAFSFQVGPGVEVTAKPAPALHSGDDLHLRTSGSGIQTVSFDVAIRAGESLLSTTFYLSAGPRRDRRDFPEGTSHYLYVHAADKTKIYQVPMHTVSLDDDSPLQLEVSVPFPKGGAEATKAVLAWL